MAVSDALFSATVLLDYISQRYHIEQFYPNGVPGDIICKVLAIISKTSYRVSLVTLLVISIKRFRATRRTLKRPRPYTVKQRVAVLGICWLIPMIPAGYGCYETKYNEETKVCGIFQEEKLLTYFILSFSTMTSVICIILTLSAITVRRLSKPQLTRARLNQEQKSMRRKRTRSAVSMVLFSALLYTCCWFPVSLTVFYVFLENYFPKVFSPDYCIDWISLLYITADVLPSANACLSPFIYLIFLPDFKEAAKRVLCCCKTTINQRDAREEIPLHHIQR